MRHAIQGDDYDVSFKRTHAHERTCSCRTKRCERLGWFDDAVVDNFCMEDTHASIRLSIDRYLERTGARCATYHIISGISSAADLSGERTAGVQQLASRCTCSKACPARERGNPAGCHLKLRHSTPCLLSPYTPGRSNAFLSNKG